MRTVVLISAFILICGVPARGAEQDEATKWAAEDSLDAKHMGQNDTTVSVVGRIQLAQREWSAEDREAINKIDAGIFFASKMLGRRGWVDCRAAFQVRLADAGQLDWLRRNQKIKQLQVQGRLRVDGKYLLIEDCRPAMEKPAVAPVLGRGKRSGM